MAKRFDPEALIEAMGRGEIGCGDFEIHIDRNGDWHYRGSRIERLPLVKLFATVLHRAPDGGYVLVTPVERGRISVEDAPFVIVELRCHGRAQDQRLEFRTNLDDWVAADATHRLVMRQRPADAEPVPYLLMDRGLEARLSTSVYYELVDLADEEGDSVGVRSAGVFFPLGTTAEAEGD